MSAQTPVRVAERIQYASWENWDPRTYLATYFSHIRRDEEETLKFLVESLVEFRGRERFSRVLEFGAGPTVVHAAVAAPYSDKVHISDYLEDNLFEVQKWIDNGPGAFDWGPFIKRILELEGQSSDEVAVRRRTEELRTKIGRKLRCDASLAFPVIDGGERYPLVIATYCADSATSSKDVWYAYTKNISQAISPGGTFLMAALRGCSFYKLGEYYFPSANIFEDDVSHAFHEIGFRPGSIQIQVAEVPECADEGYTSLLFAKAQKRW